MKASTKLKLWFACLFWPLMRLWYGITMRLSNRRRFQPVAMYSTPEGIAKAIDFGDDYKSDPLRGKLDLLYHPRRIQAWIDGEQDIGDCDDHAIYWIATLFKSGLAKRAWLTVYMMEHKDSSGSAHAICVYVDNDGVTKWADYRVPKRVANRWEACAVSARQRDARPLGAYALEVVRIAGNDTPRFGKGNKHIGFPSE